MQMNVLINEKNKIKQLLEVFYYAEEVNFEPIWFENIKKDDLVYNYTDDSKLKENLNNLQLQSDSDSDTTSKNE